MSVNGTLVKDKMRRIKGECAHFSFSKCHIYTDDGASAKWIIVHGVGGQPALADASSAILTSLLLLVFPSGVQERLKRMTA